MQQENFENWCRKATEQIRYGPDRRAVSEELMAHLEDHRDALRAQGLGEKESEQHTLASMGSAEEIAPQLAEIHKPWLGYLSSLIKAVAILTATLAIFFCISICVSWLHTLISSRNFDSIPANNGTLDYYCHPMVSTWSDGYRFQISEAGYSKQESDLYILLEIFHWPWMDQPGVSDHLWAIDSLGNYYPSMHASQYSDQPRVTAQGWQSTTCIILRFMCIKQFDCDAQWVELHYDRDGRNIVLRIDLTGGGKHE